MAPSLCAAVEGDNAGANVEGRLIGDEDPGEEPAAADLGGTAALKRKAGLRADQASSRANGKAAGIEHTPPGQFDPDPIDPRQRSAIRSLNAPGETDGNGSGTMPGKGQRADAAVEADDQVAFPGPLGTGARGEEGNGRQDA